jgi:large subunit ribosomal protein L18
MGTKIRRHTSEKLKVRMKRRTRIRARVEGTAERPRLSVFRSNRNLFVQLIDDTKAATLVSASSLDEDFGGKTGTNIEGAKALGGLVAKRALAKKIDKVVFDRSGYLYHGRVKAFADAAREAGLQF